MSLSHPIKEIIIILAVTRIADNCSSPFLGGFFFCIIKRNLSTKIPFKVDYRENLYYFIYAFKAFILSSVFASNS